MYLIYAFINALFLQIPKERGTPTDEEAYTFFTFSFEPDPQDGIESINRESQQQGDTAQQNRDEEEEDEAEDHEDGGNVNQVR